MLRTIVLIALLAATPLSAQQVKDISVDVVNRSEPELCAEKDNVWLDFNSRDVRTFRIQAIHPAFIGGIVVDSWAPDFTSCDMTNDPVFAAHARRVTFYESPDLWLTGYTYPSFWRPNTVPFRVGDRVEQGLHMVQVWVRNQERAEEVLVVYPADGYWRARPLAPPHLRWTAYGSSFLVGPVEVQGRPIVDLRDIVFDPATRSFTINFKRGGSASLKIETLDNKRIILDVRLAGVEQAEFPFLAMRSMYMTEFNADVARVAWRTPDGQAWSEAPVMSYSGGKASELWAGRMLLSRHNTSAPDLVFSRFRP